MKKIFSLTLLTLFLMFFSFVIFPVKVFASVWLTAGEWFNHISQFDFGFAYGEIDDYGDILIVEEPSHELDGCNIDNHTNDFKSYFEPGLGADLYDLRREYQYVLGYLEENYEDFDGYLYWNFFEKYWQIEYFEASELDYYKHRVDELEDEISTLEDEISTLEDEISSLEDEIQQLKDALENNVAFDYDIIKWFVPLVIVIILVAVIKPLISIKRRDE